MGLDFDDDLRGGTCIILRMDTCQGTHKRGIFDTNTEYQVHTTFIKRWTI